MAAGRHAQREATVPSANRLPNSLSAVTPRRSSSCPSSTDSNHRLSDPIHTNETSYAKDLNYDHQVQTASTELLNDSRVTSTSASGRCLLKILMETEQDLRNQRRERLSMDGHK